jgi:hypothetical protein
MPLYEKNRFQKGVVSSTAFDKLFPDNDLPYREHFARHFA